MIKKILIGFVLRWIDSSLKIDYKQIDKKAFEEWAINSFYNKGWRSYLAYEDLKILKELGIPRPDYMYWQLIGRREQLLLIGNEFRKAVELKKSEEEKKKSEQNKNNG